MVCSANLDRAALEQLRELLPETLAYRVVYLGVEHAVRHMYPLRGVLLCTRDGRLQDYNEIAGGRSGTVSCLQSIGKRNGIVDDVEVPAGNSASLLAQSLWRELAIENVCSAERLEQFGVVERGGGDDGRKPGQPSELEGCPRNASAVRGVAEAH